MINLMEAAALAALEDLLEDGQTSVGISFDLRHLAATPVGQRVKARAEAIEVNGRKVTFKVQAWDQQELIGEGVHGRMIVNKAKFFARIQHKVPAA
jgi:predicted thioesterase